jgi:glycosyltransferase involved in cell wall biosynthesis
VLRTYKRPDIVGRAIESVLNQTYEQFELIVIDDHSPDETPGIVREYEARDDRIRYIRNEKNRGHVTTLNIACRAATGTYVAFLDDDDVWLPNKLEAQIKRLEELSEGYAMVYGATRHKKLETEETITTSDPGLEGDIYYEVLKRGSGSVFGPPSGVMIRKSILKELGYFNEELTRGAGQALFRTIAKRYKIAYTDELCVDYYIHDQRVTTMSSEAEIQEAIDIAKRKISRLEEDLKRVPSAYRREYERLGNLYCVSREMKKGRNCFKKALKQGGITATVIIRLSLAYFGHRIYTLFFNPEFRFRQTAKKYKQFIPFDFN